MLHRREEGRVAERPKVRLHQMTDDRAVELRAASDPTLRWFVPTWRWQVTVTWTNWTFGAWWGKVGKKYMLGIDLGPLEITRVRSFVRSTRPKHRPRA